MSKPKPKYEHRKTDELVSVETHNFGLPVADGEVELTTPPPKPKVKVEPRSTAEAMCDAAGVPREMASKMIVTTIS